VYGRAGGWLVPGLTPVERGRASRGHRSSEVASDGVEVAGCTGHAAFASAIARCAVRSVAIVSAPERQYTADVPVDVTARLASICLALPDAYEQAAWVGTRWMVRKRTFAHVLGIELDGQHSVVVAFRSAGEELEVLRNVGHPYVALGWGRDAMGLMIDDDTDWGEVRELMTESYCVMAPKKLIALVDRPHDP
jgi:hypothetical protein